MLKGPLMTIDSKSTFNEYCLSTPGSEPHEYAQEFLDGIVKCKKLMDDEAKQGHPEPTASAKEYIVENFKKYLVKAEQ